MTTECSTTAADTAQENEYEEPSDAEVRRALNLRPAHYPETGAHPDRRPCPSWCWMGQDEHYDHEIDWTHPLAAEHSMEGNPSVVASLYPGGRPLGSQGDRYVTAATLEPRIKQLGQDAPTVAIAFRRFEGGEQCYDHDFLRLAITDARELVVALQYLIEAAERG